MHEFHITLKKKCIGYNALSFQGCLKLVLCLILPACIGLGEIMF